MSAFYGVNLRLLAAFRHLMVPLIRILVKNGIPFPEFNEVIKSAYVRLAAEECETPDRRASLARVAIVTGLNRREVDGILGEEDQLKRALDSNASAIASLLQGWHNDPEFLGPYGFPRELLFEGGGTDVPCFVDLVARYGRGVHPMVLLEELRRAGTVVQAQEHGVIRVEKRTFIPEEMAPELIEVFARGVRRYIDTVHHNLEEADPDTKRFERWVFPDYGLRAEDWEAFTKLVNDRLQEVIEDLDRKFSAFKRPDARAGEMLTVGVGMYLYKDENDDDRLFARRKEKLIRTVVSNG